MLEHCEFDCCHIAKFETNRKNLLYGPNLDEISVFFIPEKLNGWGERKEKAPKNLCYRHFLESDSVGIRTQDPQLRRLSE